MSDSRIDDEGRKICLSHEFCMCLSHLNFFPMKMFTFGGIEMLRRLDISYNNISVLPTEIGMLHNLRYLWISNNPIRSLPEQIASLVKLQEIDLRHTLISKVPLIIGALHLHELDWSDTPMAVDIKARYNIQPGDLRSLKGLLSNIHERETIEHEFVDFLQNIRFVTESHSVPNFSDLVSEAVQIISNMFSNLVDFRMFLKRADNFLPKIFSQFDAETLLRSKETFFSFQKDSQRKCLAADLEIKVFTSFLIHRGHKLQ